MEKISPCKMEKYFCSMAIQLIIAVNVSVNVNSLYTNF